jgi:hypothetical protein
MTRDWTVISPVLETVTPSRDGAVYDYIEHLLSSLLVNNPVPLPAEMNKVPKTLVFVGGS